ncbi:hypothetical protein DFH94DRAFT_694634 [Russula ochroleuca]|uniref:Uncharacterized protein n=1 Tax=Russula ochroleuca TaxID=152965 RepID=A0A9P5MSV7_9AGAM|nr:hypothetical protein DFH94DRAFT_694634 [Russula ochroleuca]
MIFSLGLALTGRDAGRIRFILVAESPIYFLLTLLSLVNRVAPALQTSLLAHKVLDILIGIASFIPILLFTFYLYLFKRRKFFPYLPKRFTLVANTFALLVIPVIVVINEIVSFLGIKYRQVPVPENQVVGNEVAVGPDMTSFQFGSEFLRSTSLALLAIYEAATFLVFFIRLASCVLAQYNIEDRAASEWEGILFRGLGWLVIGAKISAIETATGFATTSFGVILTRRVLRMIGRACIIIGVIKGPDRKEEFLILDTDKAKDFLKGTRKLRLSGVRANISSPQLVQSTMTRRLSMMVSLRQSRATFPFPLPRPNTPIANALEQTPVSSRRSSVVMPDQPTRVSPPAKSRPAPLTLERASSESHVSVVRSNGRAPTLVLRLSPMNMPSGDLLAAAMSAKWTDTATIDVGADPVLFSASELHSAPLPRFTGGPSGPLSGSPDSESPQSAWNREGSRTGPSRRSSLSPAVPPLPPDVSRTPTPQPVPREPFIWPPMQPEPEPVSVPVPTSVAAGSPPESGAIARQRSTRSRRTGSTSTVGDMSIDWIVPESSTTPGRFKGIGTAPIRMTQTPTSAAVVRSSVAIERQEESPREGGGLGGSGGGGSRRERARRDSGVLGVDDLARVRRSMQNMI